MLELLFLLLPIAAAYGWYMGKRSVRISQQRNSRSLSKNYFEGLNYLLSDQPDKAVDRFIELLQVDSDTFDTHLSLGTLFRKRGEVDRSIRVHQNLIARPSISLEQRDMAMMELAKDYLAAGLFDRAEEILVQLINDPDHSEQAETELLSVYQATKDWSKAIALVKRFKRSRRKNFIAQVAHFYCQLAESSEGADKDKLLAEALKQDIACGRAYLAQYHSFKEAGDNKQAIMALEKLVEHAPQWFVEALPECKQVFESSKRIDEYLALLQSASEKHKCVTIALAMAEEMTPEQAEVLLLSNLNKQPTMRGFHRLMQLHADADRSDASRDSLLLLSDLVEKQIKLRPKYRCRQCGFPSHTLYWQCPSCKSWGEIQRIQGLDGE